MNTLIYKNLKDEMIKNADDKSTLLVISGYVGPSIISELSDYYKKVVVVYGMYGLEGINQNLHHALQNLNNGQNIQIYYSLTGTHSKSYFIIRNNEVSDCYIGSANLSPNGLERNEYQEILMKLDSFDKIEINNYIKYILNNSSKCSDILISQNEKNNDKNSNNPLIATMPLYLIDKETKKKYTPLGSGINWGNQNGNVAVSKGAAMESYIKIAPNHIDNHPLLFPPIKESRNNKDGKITRKNDAIDIIWDDGFVMKCLLCGTGITRNGRSYPKQITSTGKGGNSLLGKYIRERMNLDIRHVITYQDLKDYGRDSIELTYIQEGVYAADFSQKRK